MYILGEEQQRASAGERGSIGKEHQDEEPMEVGVAQKNQESADRFLSILETVQRHMDQSHACLDKQESRTTTGTEMSRHLGANVRIPAVSCSTHADV